MNTSRYLRSDRLVEAWRNDADERATEHGERLIGVAMAAWTIGAFSGLVAAFTFAVIGAVHFVLGDVGGADRIVFAATAGLLGVVAIAAWTVLLVTRRTAFDVIASADSWMTSEVAAWAYRHLHSVGDGDVADALRAQLEHLDLNDQVNNPAHAELIGYAEAA